jgi:hypothetical protein
MKFIQIKFYKIYYCLREKLFKYLAILKVFNKLNRFLYNSRIKCFFKKNEIRNLIKFLQYYKKYIFGLEDLTSIQYLFEYY